MDRFDYLLHHKGAFLIFLLFLIPGFPKDYLCYILGLGHLTTLEFLAIATTGRLLGTMLLTLGGTFLRNHQYYSFFLLSGAAVVIVFLTIAYRDRLERFFKGLHERHLRRRGNTRSREPGGAASGTPLFRPVLFPFPLLGLLPFTGLAELPDPVHDLPVERPRG